MKYNLSGIIASLLIAPALVLADGGGAIQEKGSVEIFCKTTVASYSDVMEGEIGVTILTALSREPLFKNLDIFQQSGFLRMLGLVSGLSPEDAGNKCLEWIQTSAEMITPERIESCNTWGRLVKVIGDTSLRSPLGNEALSVVLTEKMESMRPAVLGIIEQARSMRKGVEVSDLAVVYYQECAKQDSLGKNIGEENGP
jgi:hypothetical protein